MDMSFAFHEPARIRQPRTVLNYAALLARAAATQALSPTARAAMLLGQRIIPQKGRSGSFHGDTARLIINQSQVS
jgi:hypothetical protein